MASTFTVRLVPGADLGAEPMSARRVGLANLEGTREMPEIGTNCQLMCFQ